MSDTKLSPDLPEVSLEALEVIQALDDREKRASTLVQLVAHLSGDCKTIQDLLADLVAREIVAVSRYEVCGEKAWYRTYLGLSLAAPAAERVAFKEGGALSSQRPLVGRSLAGDLGLMEESALNAGRPLSTVYLAKIYFPNRMRFNQINTLGQQNVQALVMAMKVWEENGASLSTIKAMIDEFCKHREWCKGKIAWRVFLARREQLLTIVQRHQKEAEAEVNGDDEDYWMGRGKWAIPDDPREEDEDYWLGRGKWANYDYSTES